MCQSLVLSHSCAGVPCLLRGPVQPWSPGAGRLPSSRHLNVRPGTHHQGCECWRHSALFRWFSLGCIWHSTLLRSFPLCCVSHSTFVSLAWMRVCVCRCASCRPPRKVSPSPSSTRCETRQQARAHCCVTSGSPPCGCCVTAVSLLCHYLCHCCDDAFCRCQRGSIFFGTLWASHQSPVCLDSPTTE